MAYKIITTPAFERNFKKLFKKYLSLQNDLINLLNDLIANPLLGIPLGNQCYKIRLKISSKSKGKSAGARVITYVLINEEEIYLLSIYDKSELESLSDERLKSILKSLNK